MYSRHVHANQPNHIHLICLRRLLHIRWQDKNPDTEVIERAGIPSVDTFLQRAQVRWAGHVARIPGCRLPKQVLYGKLCQGKWSFGAEDMHQRRPRSLSSICLSSTFEGRTTTTSGMAENNSHSARCSNSSICLFVQTNYTDVNSTALSINNTGGVKGTCKKANPYYRGLAYNDTLQKFRITFTANGRLQFAPCT